MANEITLEAQLVTPDTGEPQFQVRFFPSSETDERLQESAAVMRKLRQSTVSLPISPLEFELDPITGTTDTVETIMLTLMGVDEEGRVQFRMNLLMRGGATLTSDSAWVLSPRESSVAWEKLTGPPRSDDPITLPERPDSLTADLCPDIERDATATHRLYVDVNDFLWSRLMGTIRTMCDLVQTEAHLGLMDNEVRLESLHGSEEAEFGEGQPAAADEYQERYLWVRLAEESTFEVAVKTFSEVSQDRDLVSGRIL
ncbi:MAG: hypothetical protein WD382_06825 [Halofilum sp. (in: g-proteobacteria)]